MIAQAVAEPRMLLVLVGAALVFGGIVVTAFRGNWGGRFRTRSRTDSAAGLRPRANWPGLAMLAGGIGCLLAAAAV
ncbi:hypothetical protein MOX02_23560 [Methylobacterium oxalidis]|uniref:Uncharacterized protein n=2 Tax=Methylobacterium oxalidis TaxID=944322 RepID=A0A512J2X2_9HYPH|nr:hypothetical protein MOX02_23560 [Methylobacterium oxalidis]GJE30613.1 hypothetical protein LDDCCGHA_0782 [Methylobacterium oxalidis]GLS67163.1 hypothetical protein GCM10007888_55460 [Methylobacterium oxalidis]